MQKFFLIIAAVVAFSVVLSLVLTYPFMWVWNYAVVSTITIAKPIDDFWVGFCLMMFISCFMKSSNSSTKE